ncbi:MAG: alpha/beta fold hydrolase [Deltaproteobacteria bacterium]|nr:alpha/beta fold hydrolase [Deltaproteobacteria bacterium]
MRLTTADGVKLTGALRQGQPGLQKAGVVMIHGYSGNFYSSIMEFLPEALTDRDFCSLAVNMRDHDRVPKKNLFEDNRHDIAAAVAEMERRGCSPIFLYGHSMGTNRVLYYQAATEDPRIAGMILTGPPGNLYEWNVRIFGQDAAAQLLRRAQDLKTAGKGNEWMLINLGPLGKTLYTANHLVSLRGPETVSDPYKNIGRISLPVLIVHGLADRLADPVVADRLSSHAGSGTKVNVVKIGGAGHSFRKHQQELVDTIYKWLHKHLAP